MSSTPAQSSIGTYGPSRLPMSFAMAPPAIAPTVDPTPTIANKRFPCAGSYTSFANDQNCATTQTLKMPIQM